MDFAICFLLSEHYYAQLLDNNGSLLII